MGLPELAFLHRLHYFFLAANNALMAFTAALALLHRIRINAP
jgi:hypothetical protein